MHVSGLLHERSRRRTVCVLLQQHRITTLLR